RAPAPHTREGAQSSQNSQSTQKAPKDSAISASSAASAFCFLDLFESEDAVLEIDSHPVFAQEFVSDYPAQLKAEQRARGVQVQDDDREVRVLDRVERQVDAGKQKRVFVPAGRAEYFQLDLARRLAASDGAGRRPAD